MRSLLIRSITLRGFLVREFGPQSRQFPQEMAGWIKDGRIRYLEDITEGLANAPAAFLGMLQGKNFGKTLDRL